ncbi:hypothetical protein BCF11_3460 [Collimonas sp. PA-H2]|uniref:imm11 family protein n=1 Tax=Collimonas sp. PA-H2 TaxID=1881062 RepID=UPI000C01207B|nr:DUF1629 domain-containing protein [Collimonas sp. PA-H2]PFH11020.1 hypothetical protein BCF11_3460 [Collimonas sp. PA-H2]
MMKYFKWQFDSKFDGCWFIGEPHLPNGEVVNSWAFRKCQVVEPPYTTLAASTTYGDIVTEASFGAFDIPYVRPKMASALLNHVGNQIQLIPVHVDGFNEEVFILNILNSATCVDESRSEFEKWEPGNTQRPDKVGQYKMISKLFVDPSTTNDLDIFRPWGWTIKVIISERLKSVIEAVGATGTNFELVS